MGLIGNPFSFNGLQFTSVPTCAIPLLKCSPSGPTRAKWLPFEARRNGPDPRGPKMNPVETDATGWEAKRPTEEPADHTKERSDPRRNLLVSDVTEMLRILSALTQSKAAGPASVPTRTNCGSVERLKTMPHQLPLIMDYAALIRLRADACQVRDSSGARRSRRFNVRTRLTGVMPIAIRTLKRRERRAPGPRYARLPSPPRRAPYCRPCPSPT